jgi:hypothetical protein
MSGSDSGLHSGWGSGSGTAPPGVDERSGTIGPAKSSLLEEIASLLVLLHETYLADAIGPQDTLVKLLELIEDIGLDDKITVLEVEMFRRRCQAEGSGALGQGMGYETFYCCLRDIAGFVFQLNTQQGGKRSLHCLLTQYIIPFCRGKAQQVDTSMSISMSSIEFPRTIATAFLVLEEYTFDEFIMYKDFLKLWYGSMILQVPQQTDSLDIFLLC